MTVLSYHWLTSHVDLHKLIVLVNYLYCEWIFVINNLTITAFKMGMSTGIFMDDEFKMQC